MASMQGLFSAMYLGFGRGCGALLGGMIYYGYGAKMTFRAGSAWIAAGWALVTLLHLALSASSCPSQQSLGSHSPESVVAVHSSEQVSSSDDDQMAMREHSHHRRRRPEVV
mmetsp:Transcript_24217/g.67332  ORF Transcript_24217/g.67332 Transcript_24217/m.67332 type:complete len:111 (-) Transcript_24217:123-455(-)